MLKVDRVRQIIVGGIIAIVVVVLGYSVLYTFNLLPSFGSTPDRYVVLDRQLRTDPIVVEEFFTFSCEHCRNFDPAILDWAENLPDGVEFTQTHVAFSRTDEFLAKSFLVLSARDVIDENRQRLFAEIHDKQNRFLSPDSIAEFIDGNGISRESFLALYHGDRISRLAKEKQDHLIDVRVASVPFVLVGNKYGVFVTQGRREAINTIDFLVEELRAGREPPPLTGEEPQGTATSSETSSGDQLPMDGSPTEDVLESTNQESGETPQASNDNQ